MNKMREQLEYVIACSLSVAAGRAHRDLSEPKPWDEADEEYRVDELLEAVREYNRLEAEWEELHS